MKSLNEIIQEIDERQLPSDMGQVGEYIKQMASLGISSSSRISMLVAHSRRVFFNEESGFHKWAKESLGFTPNHTSHCAKIGSLLLDAGKQSFHKLALLPFNKLIAVSRLTPGQIEKLIDKDLAAMTRDQLRDEVRKELGEAAPEPKAKPDLNAENFKAIKGLAGLKIEELDSLVKSSGSEDVEAMLKAGRNLLAAGIEAASVNNLGGALEAASRLLSIQLNEIRKKQDALKAANTVPQLESKTA